MGERNWTQRGEVRLSSTLGLHAGSTTHSSSLSLAFVEKQTGVFRLLDTDGDGFVSYQELLQAKASAMAERAKST